MRSNTKLITTGYTGYGKIVDDDDKTTYFISLSSYSLTVNRNLIISNGVYNSAKKDANGIYTNSNAVNEIYRTSNPVIPDFPTVDLQINIQCTKSLFEFFCKMISENRNKNLKICFIDQSVGFNFEAKYNFLRSFNFSVDSDSILQIELSFLTFTDSLNISNDNFELRDYIRKQLAFDYQNRLMPYWDFSITSNITVKKDEDTKIINSVQLGDIISFDFSFEQDLIPKYGLVASTFSTPLMCKKVLFSLPKISFNLSKLMYLKNEYNFMSSSMYGERMVTTSQIDYKSFSICFRGGKYINLYGVVLQNLSPRVGQMNEVSIYEQSYYVTGYISFGDSGVDYPETKEQILIINGKQSKYERLTLYATQIPMLENSVSIYEKLDQIQKIIG